jgi:hypothetical protein
VGPAGIPVLDEEKLIQPMFDVHAQPVTRVAACAIEPDKIKREKMKTASAKNLIFFICI